MSETVERLRRALESPDPSARLQTAMAAGTRPDEAYVDVLLARCAVEPDGFVRDTLTWALMRHPVEATVPPLVEEARDGGPQARAQALHTLSKIRDPRGWDVAAAAVRHPDERVARTAWRAAVLLAPEGERPALAVALTTQLGRGGRDLRAALARAFLELGEAADPALAAAEAEAARREEPAVRLHAAAVRRLLADPDAGFETAELEAEHVLLLAAADPEP